MSGKIWVDVCLISGRGLRRSSSLLKLQWYAVGWIDSANKYCTSIDASGKPNPVWKTRFSTAVEAEQSSEDLALHVEVYSRDPIFLRERLLGSATVLLKEFLDKYDAAKPVEEVGSFQLWKRNSNKPLGFVDVSIRISKEREEPSSYLDADEGFNLNLHDNETSYQMPIPPPPPNYLHYPPPAGGSSYQLPPNVGYNPNFFPTASNNINMPPVRGVGMGLGAGALISGEDFMYGSRGASVYPPF